MTEQHQQPSLPPSPPQQGQDQEHEPPQDAVAHLQGHSNGSMVNSLANFQQHSRLHFIGRWRTNAHDILHEIYTSDPKLRETLALSSDRIAQGKEPMSAADGKVTMIHLDMDAFFCNVALTKPENAAYRGRPVAIAAGKNRSDVSSCNYEAKRQGVRQGMWVGEAKEKCPDLITLEYDFPRCEAINRQVYRIVLEECPPNTRLWLQVYSVDDTMIALFTDNVDVVREYCSRVRRRIENETGCTASCGAAINILLARLATADAKPNGQRILASKEEADLFIRNTKIQDLHGVGGQALVKIVAEFVKRFPAQSRSFGLDVDALINQRRHSYWAPPPPMNIPVPHGSAIANEAKGDAEGNDEVDVTPDASGDEADGDGEESEAAKVKKSLSMLTCEVLQQLSLGNLQSALGKKVGENIYKHCRGIDNRVVVPTGVAGLDDPMVHAVYGKNAAGTSSTGGSLTLPGSFASTMNYAVRPKVFKDISDLYEQLARDVCAKMLRKGAQCSSARLTVLERHPESPVEPIKFLGCGRCNEFHWSIKPTKPLRGEESDQLTALCIDILKKITLLPGQDRTSVKGMVTTAGEMKVVPLVDFRGVGLQVSGLSVIHKGGLEKRHSTSSATAATRRSTEQVSLTAAFQRQAEKRRSKRDNADVVDDSTPSELSGTGVCPVLASGQLGGDDDNEVVVENRVLNRKRPREEKEVANEPIVLSSQSSDPTQSGLTPAGCGPTNLQLEKSGSKPSAPVLAPPKRSPTLVVDGDTSERRRVASRMTLDVSQYLRTTDSDSLAIIETMSETEQQDDTLRAEDVIAAVRSLLSTLEQRAETRKSDVRVLEDFVLQASRQGDFLTARTLLRMALTTAARMRCRILSGAIAEELLPKINKVVASKGIPGVDHLCLS